jgi:glycosyltransferase 2 family protein
MQIIQKTLLIIIITIIIYAGFLFLSDATKIIEGLKKFDVKFLPIILVVIPISWFALFLRWHYLTKNVGITLPIKENILIYFSGFSLAITPGKFGELIKSEIMKKKFSIPRTSSAPLVIVERLYDLVGGVSVAVLGILTLGYGAYVIIIAGIILVVIFSLLRSKKLFDIVINLFNKRKFSAKFANSISESYDTIRKSIGPRILIISSLFTILYWLLEGIGVYLIVLSFGVENLSYFNILATYASALILGAASFIPGGLGVTEGSMVGLLNFQGVETSIAVILVIMIRLFTMWYNVLIGFIALKFSGGFSLFKQSSE